MAGGPKDTRSTIIPALRYRGAKAAIGWLCEVFDFAQHAVYEGADGSVAHAELGFGNGMVMLGSVVDNEYGRNICQPTDILAGKKPKHPISSLRTLMQSIPERRPPDSKSWSTLRTRITAAADLAAGIRRAIFGT